MTTVAYDWVQVVHPDSKDIYFVNPTTGKCLTDKPEQGIIKPNDPNGEWWELWDDANDMPYYYHTTSGQAHWNQPADTPVISLTNTDIRLEQVVPEAGSSVLKRNSRSLDLPSTRSIPPTTAYHHTRSTSDGNNANTTTTSTTPPSPPPPPPPMMTTTTTTTTTTNTSPLCIQEESHDSLSAALPNGSMGLFGFRWARKQSVVSEMGDLAAARQRRLSNFSAFRGKTSSSWKNLVTRTQSSPRNSIAVSTPVSNPEAAAAMHPTKWMDPFSLQAQTEKKPILPSNLQQEITQFAIDGFAQKYFAKHKRGIIFKRQVPMEEMLRWTKESLKQPLIMLNKDLYKDALKCFKLIQIIMGDRPRPRQSTEIEEYQTLLGCGISKGQMRDEIYVQVCKQLNNNPNGQSIRKGWEILCVISVTFPPSKNLESYLNNFVDQSTHVTQNQVDVISQYVSTRLKRICARGAKGKVLTAAEIERAKEAPFKPSIFGEDLELIISLPSHCDNGLKIPKIVPFLADAVLKMNGLQSEGIFRVPGDAEEVTDLRVRIENGNYDASGITDPNVPASLLKYWLRDLEKPLIPTELYDECVKFAENSDEAIAIVNALPDLNRRIVMYMIASVQEFNREEVTQYTRMNVNNLAMVFAPNFLRCPSDSLTTVFQNSKYEQAFVRTLINDMQTEKESCAYGDEAPLAKKRCSDD